MKNRCKVAILIYAAFDVIRSTDTTKLFHSHQYRVANKCQSCGVISTLQQSRPETCRERHSISWGHLQLRGGQGAQIDEEYHPFMRGDPSSLKNGMALGSVEREEISSRLPWPPGSEDKMHSFNEYQAQYKQAKNDLLVASIAIRRLKLIHTSHPSEYLFKHILTLGGGGRGTGTGGGRGRHSPSRRSSRTRNNSRCCSTYISP
jgi:hypothetical protein